MAEALRLGAMGYVLKGSPATEVLSGGGRGGAFQRQPPRSGCGRARGHGRWNKPACKLPGRAALGQLSARERQIIVPWWCAATPAPAIGGQLHLSPKTVDSYRSRLMIKLGVSDVPALVRLSIREGLISASEI